LGRLACHGRMEFQWQSNVSMAIPLAHGNPMRIPWASNGPWVSRGMPTGSHGPIASVGIPWAHLVHMCSFDSHGAFMGQWDSRGLMGIQRHDAFDWSLNSCWLDSAHQWHRKKKRSGRSGWGTSNAIRNTERSQHRSQQREAIMQGLDPWPINLVVLIFKRGSPVQCPKHTPTSHTTCLPQTPDSASHATRVALLNIALFSYHWGSVVDLTLLLSCGHLLPLPCLTIA
jgi:hypothetical protein